MFARNTAGTAGGALYLSCLNTDPCYFDVRQNVFNQNIAGIKGGAIFYDFQQPDGITDNSYSQNEAKYGGYVASYPFTLQPIGNDNQWA